MMYSQSKSILSKDIWKHHRCSKEAADVWLVKESTWSDSIVNVHAMGSNDSGVSWIVEVEGKRIFHAGDLNNWYARFLTDDYQGGTIWSMEFVDQFHVGLFVPMHFVASGFKSAWRMKEFTDAKGIPFLNVSIEQKADKKDEKKEDVKQIEVK